MKKLFHQGDVQGVYIEEMPSSASKIDKRIIVKGNEHIHAVTGDYEMFEDNRFTYVKTGIVAILQHLKDEVDLNTTNVLPAAQHGPIKLEPNTIIKFGIHRRKNSFKKIWEQVLD